MTLKGTSWGTTRIVKELLTRFWKIYVMGFRSKRLFLISPFRHVCTTICNGWWSVSHHHSFATILSHFVSEEVCDSSDLISRAHATELTEFVVYLSSTEGYNSCWSRRRQSLFVCAVANRKRGWTGAERSKKLFHFLHTVLPTKKMNA